VGAEGHDSDHTLAGRDLRDVLPGLPDGARALVPDDVRLGGERPAGAVADVTALDRDGLHLDEDGPRTASGIRDVLVAEDVRGAGLVVDGSLHRRSSLGTGGGP
jgi:hypothetical protein